MQFDQLLILLPPCGRKLWSATVPHTVTWYELFLPQFDSRQVFDHSCEKSNLQGSFQTHVSQFKKKKKKVHEKLYDALWNPPLPEFGPCGFHCWLTSAILIFCLVTEAHNSWSLFWAFGLWVQSDSSASTVEGSLCFCQWNMDINSSLPWISYI